MNALKSSVTCILKTILPDFIKNKLFHLSYHLAEKEFNKFAYLYAYAPHMENSLLEFASRGFQPNFVVDVGSYHGDWSRMARRIWPNSKLIMIEGNRQKEYTLRKVAKQIDAELHIELLGANDDVNINFNVMESGSSVLGERSPLDRTVESRTLRRLDTVVRDLKGPVFLKMDTQGYELEVLRGASGILTQVEAILLEVAVIEINEGAPLLHEVLVFLKSVGFVTYDIPEIHRRPLDRALNQIDILFIRETSHLLVDRRHFA